uniref:MICOS complex subunit MIC10 n=1 Tax=Kwoniella pini CBS 10737 TaxID=1296096 RepID=A0A1B9I850_9TREE|nr:uncharacterized protein I206_02468 [Kwoniella pini CBS 10737]OCF51752.1 hypothetical protein I206_02468 [Kwoniella pini CBS 10737]
MSTPVAIPTPPAPIAAPIPSEDQIARKFDNCVADLLVNAGLGFGVGVVASVLLFRTIRSSFLSNIGAMISICDIKGYSLNAFLPTTGRGWPVALSTGFGAGVAYSNCNYSLNPYVLPGTKVLPASKS